MLRVPTLLESAREGLMTGFERMASVRGLRKRARLVRRHGQPGATDPWSPLRKAMLIGEIVLAYAHSRRLMRGRGLPATLRDLRGRTEGGKQTEEGIVTAVRLGRATGRTLGALPADSRCLMQSLVVSRLLDRRGIASTLVIGVQEPGEHFGAHAWVEVAGQPVLESGGGAFGRLVEL
jgi:hypothetical protein